MWQWPCCYASTLLSSHGWLDIFFVPFEFANSWFSETDPQQACGRCAPRVKPGYSRAEPWMPGAGFSQLWISASEAPKLPGLCLHRGLPALAQGQLSPTTAAARDPFRNSPLEFIHPASQSGQPAVWAEPVSEVTVDVTNVTMNPRLLRLVSQDIAGAGKDAAKKAVHPPTNQLCLPIRNECLIYRSPPWQKSKHHSNPSFSPPCSQGVPWKMQKWIWREMESSQTCKSNLCFFSVSVQDFLEKAKKVFEEKWVVNPKVSGFRHQMSSWAFFTFVFSSMGFLSLRKSFVGSSVEY